MTEQVVIPEHEPFAAKTDYAMGWKRVAVGMTPALLGLAAYGVAVAAGWVRHQPGLFPAFIVWVFASLLAPHAYVKRRTALILGIVVAVPAFAAVLAMNHEVVKVQGSSMTPALFEGDALLVDTRAEPQLLDIWVLEVGGENNPLVKRVVGLPGQTLSARDGKLFANGVEVHAGGTGGEVTDFGRDRLLAEGEYFVLGDNPAASRDSRRFGPVPREAFKGRVVWQLKGSQGFSPVN